MIERWIPNVRDMLRTMSLIFLMVYLQSPRSLKKYLIPEHSLKSWMDLNQSTFSNSYRMITNLVWMDYVDVNLKA